MQAQKSVRGKLNLLLWITFASLWLIPLFFKNPIVLHIFILIYFYAFLSLSWDIVGGLAGQLSLGHAAFSVIGAYASTLLLLNWGITPWVGMIAGGIVASLLSVIIGYPCFKLRGAYYALSTLAFAELIRVFIINTESFMGLEIKGASGLLLPVMGHAPAGFQFVDKRYYYYIILLFCSALTLFIAFFNRSRLGYYLAAIREDQDAAQALGINVTACKLFAAMISAFFTALGGVFYAQYVLYISAQSLGAMHLSLEMAFISIVGGKGTLLGPIFGSFLLTPLGELTRVYFGGTYIGIHLVFYGAILMAVVKFMPSGILIPLRDLFTKFFASRRVGP